MIEIQDERHFTPIQQLKGAFLLISESLFHLRSKTHIEPDPNNKSRLILTRTVMTQHDKDLLTEMRKK